MVLPPTPPPTCYKALCSNPAFTGIISLSSYQQKLDDIYANWMPADDAMDRYQLLEEVLLDMSVGMPGGILAFVTSPEHAADAAKIIQNVRKHPGEDGHRGECFAYVGDVSGQDIELVSFSSFLLERLPWIGCLTNVNTHLEEIQGELEMQVRPAPLAKQIEEGKAALYRTRQSMFVPAPLLPCFLTEEAINPMQALKLILPLVRFLEIERQCEPLVCFLMVASTAGSGPDLLQPHAGEAGPNTVMVAKERRDNVLYHQLPILRPESHGKDPLLQSLVGAMQDVREGILDDLGDRRRDRTDKARVKGIEQKWNEKTIDRLCKMCGVSHTADLPTIYHKLAAHTKADSTTPSLLQDAVEATASLLHIQHVPTMTVQHATALTGWVWFGAGSQSLGEGLIPFSIVPPNQVSAAAVAAIQAAHHQNMDYNTVMTGSTSITSKDAQKLRSAKGYIPANFEEMIVQLTAYACVLGALLGVEHPNALQHQDAVAALVINQALLKQFVNAEFGSTLGAAKIVYYFQLRHRKWFEDQWRLTARSTLPPPQLVNGFDTFATSYTINWLPNISHIDLLQRLA